MSVPKLKVNGDAGDSRMTPWWLVNELARRYGGFRLDVAASSASAKALFWYTAAENGLEQPWGGTLVVHAAQTHLALVSSDMAPSAFFCNPPWSNIKPWVDRGLEEVLGPKPSARAGIYVLPARLSSSWWPDLARWAEVLKPIRGRVQFPPEDPSVKSSSNPEATVYAIIRADIQRPR